MGIFNNNERFINTHIREYVKYINSQIQTGLKLDSNNNYDIQQKRLTNVAEGVDSNDAITKHQMEVGLSTKPNPTDVILVNGRNHMTGDLNLGGNQIISPGGINMYRKLIVNLDVDPNQDLSAVNMVTLKNKVDPKADKTYVDQEISKVGATTQFVKKTGDQNVWRFDFAAKPISNPWKYQ